jgi:hypothetical protein
MVAVLRYSVRTRGLEVVGQQVGPSVQKSRTTPCSSFYTFCICAHLPHTQPMCGGMALVPQASLACPSSGPVLELLVSCPAHSFVCLACSKILFCSQSLLYLVFGTLLLVFGTFCLVLGTFCLVFSTFWSVAGTSYLVPNTLSSRFGLHMSIHILDLL